MDKKDILPIFHQWLSSLDYFNDLNDNQQDAKALIQTDMSMHRKISQLIENVPLRFSSEQHYQKVWEKLFYDEVKAQITRTKAEYAKQPEIVEIMQVDPYSNWFKKILLKKITNNGVSYSIGTLVILSPVQPTRKQRYPHLIGFVQSGQIFTVKAPLNQKLKQSKPEEWELMASTKKWYIQQLCSVSTLERQYVALRSFSKICPQIRSILLRPDEHQKQIEKKFRIPGQLDEKLKQVYNESQYKAINQCLKQSGITMIQGPPGTGKTKTVLGTLSILLSSYRRSEEQEQAPLILSWKKSAQVIKQSKMRNPWLYTDYKDWRDEPYLEDQDQGDFLGLSKFYTQCEESDRKVTLIKKSQGIQLPGKVLICGPSNASVDQIIRKLVKQNLFDKQGQTYLPSFVRVGQNYDQAIKQYSLDYQAEKIAEKQKGSDVVEIKNRILKEYRLVFGTLSSIGSNVIQNSTVKFDTVVIDQAGQSIQISNLIPLMYDCQRLILIGDPNQLPATVFSIKSLEHNYDQSLFERLMKSGFPVSVLKMQYRMHPQISEVIGRNFYGEKLQSWPGLIVEQPRLLPSSFLIFHVEQSAQSSFKKSFRNMTEAKIAKDLAAYLSRDYKDIGIVSPYSQQVLLIQSLSGNKKWQTKTIDSFQGRQKNVIIFSAVRSRYTWRNKSKEENKRKTIGFVGDLRRINVSLSRAKNVCVIIGDIKRLSINHTWNNIIRDALSRKQVYQFSQKKNFLQNLNKNPHQYMIKTIQ